ncbi:MAG TPA: M48 family metallopeptidase [Burkholderiales bacterium]|nr:M48 family metallopeptidase [Burkholderiales bacterium]
MSYAFTWVFLAALASATAGRLWLAARQSRYVRAHRDAVPESFAGAIPLAAHQKAADYTIAKGRLQVTEICLNALLLLLLTLGGAVQWISAQWERVFPLDSITHGTALILTVLALTSAIGLPATLYRIFGIEERFGFNKMTWKLFIIDTLKGIVLAVVIGVPLLVAVLWLMRAAGAYWWLYVWVVLMAFSVFMQMIIPTFIMPWFNKFSPLEDTALVERVERLLARCGFRSHGLFVMDGSKRSAHGNAFFAGVGASKRIVLFDTLVQRLNPGEVEAVLAHELGHYKLHHIRKSLAFSFAFALVSLFILGLLVQQPWFYEGLGVQSRTLPMALLLFLLVSSEFSFFLHPLGTVLSRKHEFEADAYATRFSESADLVQALVKMYRDNASTLTPDPLHSAFYDSHPPAATRIARLRTA